MPRASEEAGASVILQVSNANHDSRGENLLEAHLLAIRDQQQVIWSQDPPIGIKRANRGFGDCFGDFRLGVQGFDIEKALE